MKRKPKANSKRKPNAAQIVAPQEVFEDYAKATAQLQNTIQSWGQNPKMLQLLKFYLSCSEVSTPANQKANYASQMVPRLYRRGSGGSKSHKGGFKVEQLRVKSKSQLSWLKSGDSLNGVGAVSEYAQGSQDIYEVTSHPFLELMRRPNRRDKGTVFRAASYLQREIFGNAYHLALFGANGLPAEIYLLYGQHVNIVESETELVGKYIYQTTGNEPIEYSPDEIAHFKHNASVTNYVYGSSWIERVIPEIQILTGAKAIEKNRMDNGCRLDMLFLMPDGNPFQREQARKEIDRRGRARNAGNYIIGDGITGAVNLSMNNKDMEYLEGQEKHGRAIRQAAGFPEAFANLNQSNLASALQAGGQFRQMVMQPILCSDAEQWTDVLVNWYGHEPGEYWVAYDCVVPINAEEKSKTALNLWKADLLTWDEARVEVDMDTVGGERGGMLFSELTAQTPQAHETEEEPLTPVNQPAKEEDKPKGKSAEVVQAEAPAADSKPIPVSSLKCVCGCKSGEQGWAFPFREQPYRQLKTGVAGWYSEGVSSGIFSAERLQKAVEPPLSTIYREGGVDGIASILAQEGGEAVVASSGVSWDVLSPESEQHLQTYTVRLSETLSATKQADLQTALADSIRAGDNTAQATAKVQAALLDRTEEEAERIARTEASRTYQEGGLAAWKEAGVRGKKWELAGGPCPLCEFIAAIYENPIGIDEPFYRLGDEVVVADKKYVFDYEDIDAAPAHPNCRCAVLPVLDYIPPTTERAEGGQ